MGHEISIIRPDREPLVLAVDDSSYRRREIMGEDELVLNFSLAVYEEIPAGSTVTFEGDTYTLFQSCRVDKRGSRNFEYQATFNADYAYLRKYMFYNWVDKRLSFDLTARPWEHIQMIVDNLNDRLQSGDMPWRLGEGCIESAEKLISYSCNNCMEALQAVADTFETEWEVKGRTIFLRKVEYNADSPLELSYGRGNGLRAGIQRTAYNDETPAARVYIQGGERNIFLSEYGSRELKFPKSAGIGYDGEKYEGEDGYDNTKGVRYVTDDLGQSVAREGGPVNGGDDVALDLTHIYPSHTCEVESVEYLYKSETYGSVDELVAAYPELADENAEGWDNVQVDVIVKEDAYLPDYSASELQVPGETRQVVFQSGNLASREFDINDYDHEERRFKLVSEWVDGFRMPAGPVYHPSAGNTFIVVGVSLPSEYVREAEDKALREAVKYLYEHEAQKVTINAEIDPIQAARMWDSWGPKIILGGFVRLTDDDLLAEVSDIRIKAVKQYVNTPTKPVVELSNSTASVSFGTTIRELENQEVHTDELHKDSIQFSKRRWREAKETISMLQGALDNFTEGISPITVETMSMLVGDERLQFVFTKSLTSNDSGNLVYAYDDATGVFSVQSAYIKHMTLGIDSISPVHSDEEYKRWQVSEVSQTLERESAYYLYAVVSKNSTNGSFELHKDVQKDTEESYYLLVGILNSEYDGLRSFAPMYGYTEVRPGQIVTENIQSADGKTWLDLLRGILHLNDNAGVSGSIDEEKGDKSIAAWFGGLMEDLEFDYNPSSPANTLFRHDGSGYLAKGNIKFNEIGEVELSPNIRISGTGSETLDSILTMLAVLNDMFYFADDETIGTKYNFFSEKENSAGGIGDAIGTSGGGIDPDELEDILKGYATEGYVEEEIGKVKTDIKTKPSTYVPLKTINGLSLYGSGNINVEGGGGGSEGLTAINVNDQSFQPDDNGIVTLPDYPVMPTIPSALPNPKALTFGSKTYNGSAASTITETDIISDIDTIRAKLASLVNYDDAEVKAAIAVLQGYFVGEKAKNADKLDGQDSRYFATASSVSTLNGTVSGLSESVTTLGEDMTDVKNRLATAESEIAANEGNIESQGSDIASLKLRMTDAEGDIADNANGIKDNAEDITDLDRRLDSIESWYNNVGSKFSKDTDGTIKMDGDFYTTGENSAGGVGESVGGTGGGGIDTEELDSILGKKGYATEKWVNEQGFAKGTIPTRVSQLENDANYLASITADMVKSALGYTPFNESNFSKLNIKTTLGISDWALAAAKPPYSYSEIINAPDMSNYATTAALDKKVDKVSGKGLSTNDYTNSEKSKLASLENYDDTDIKGRLSDLEEWYDEVGSKFSKESDGSIKMDGDFFTTGENSASGAGEAVGGTGGGIDTEELDDILDSKGYATEKWVKEQGFAKGAIPTTTSQLTNDSGFITTTTADGRYASAGDFNDLEDRVQSIESGGGTGSGDIDLSAYATKKFVNDELTKKVDKEEGMGLSENNYTDEDKSTLASLEEWHRSIGSKFTIEDGAVKMDGDFFTTGENSAGGLGESVGSTGGGLDESELEDYLTDNKYAKQSWVEDQGYAKGTIPTRVSQLDNDAKYLASITSAMVTAALGYAPFSAANFTQLNIKNKLGISDWALAAAKPPYSYSEIINAPDMSNYATTAALDKKVDKVSGKGLSTNDYTTAEKNRVASIGSLGFKDSLAFSELTDKPTTLEGYGITDDVVLASNIGEHTAGKAKQLAAKRKIWGQDFDGTKDINGDLLLQGDIGRVTDSLDYNWRIASIIDGAQLQVGWQDASSYNGNFYFTGMYGAALNLFNVRSNHSYFDGETVVFRNTGLTQFNAASTFNGGAKIASGQPLSFLDSNGAEHKITYDEASQAFKIDGDLFTTGETSAGGKGSEAFDLASVLDRIAALESNAAKNLAVDFSLLSSNIGDGKLQTVLNRIGFTTDAVNGLLDAKYNKVVGNGTYREVWNYTAHETASYIEIYLRKGDGYNVNDWYNLYFSKSTGKWNIIFGEI